MKIIKYLFLLITAALISLNCGDSTTTGANNKYLGELPGIAQAYKEKKKSLEADAKQATTMDDAFGIQQKMDLAQEEVKKNIENEVKNLKFPINVPIEGKLKTPFLEIKDLKITKCSYNIVLFTAKAIPAVTRKYIFGYFQLTDKNGKALATDKDWVIIGTSNFREIKEGVETELNGSFSGLDKLEDFEKAVFFTQEEFNKRQK